jgi:hypothetical protein
VNDESHTIEQLLDRIEATTRSGNRIPLRAILQKVGQRSFGALVLMGGLVTLAPAIGDIPGVPTVVGLYVLLTATQVLLGRHHFWLPQWLLERSISPGKLSKAIGWIRRPARFLDRLLHPRLTLFVEGSGFYAMAFMCIVIAILMPFMELIPFSANGAGAVLTAAGLSLLAHDGLLALLAYIFMAITVAIALYALM